MEMLKASMRDGFVNRFFTRSFHRANIGDQTNPRLRSSVQWRASQMQRLGATGAWDHFVVLVALVIPRIERTRTIEEERRTTD